MPFWAPFSWFFFTGDLHIVQEAEVQNLGAVRLYTQKLWGPFFQFSAASGSLDWPPRSKIICSLKSVCQELSEMVWHLHFGWKLRSLASFYHRHYELRIALGILQLLRTIYKFYGTQTSKLCLSCTTVRKLRATFGGNFGILVPRKMKIANADGEWRGNRYAKWWWEILV